MRFLLTILISFLSGLSAMAGQSWYVKVQTGTDAPAYGSLGVPSKSITNASNYLLPGDTLHVMAGEYINADFNPANIWGVTNTVRINNLQDAPGNYIYNGPIRCHQVTIRNNIDVSLNIFGGYAISIDNNRSNVIVSRNLIQGVQDPVLSSMAVFTFNAAMLFGDRASCNFALKSGGPAIVAADLAWMPAADQYNLFWNATGECGAIRFSCSCSPDNYLVI